MRKPLFFIPLLIVFLLASDIPYQSRYKPVFMYRQDMENAVRVGEPRIMVNPGKIYLKDNYILINEKYYGIHVLDNSNPEAPEKISFIYIDGCIDMAMKNDVIYTDNAVDLIAIKVSNNFSNIEVTERIRDVFPEIISPDGFWLDWRIQENRPENSILVRWEPKI